MKETGMLMTCDRCGATVFRKTSSDSPKISLRDGELSKNVVYADEPVGWDTFNGKDLCSKCSSKCKKIMKDFWNNMSEDTAVNKELEVITTAEEKNNTPK